jgi:hypothetical protein
VSAQYVGGGPPLNRGLALKEVNPARYGTLVHPGDTYRTTSSAAGRRPWADEPAVANLRPRRVIAVGESQSAFR